MNKQEYIDNSLDICNQTLESLVSLQDELSKFLSKQFGIITNQEEQ